MNTVVEAKGLFKKFDDRPVVRGVDLQIQKGEIFGLLGPNGAGKSTLMRMMYCASLISEGELYVLGLNAKKNYREIKGRIGVIPQEDGLDESFTAFDNLVLFAKYHLIEEGIARKRADDLLRLMRLENDRNKFVRELSGGMRRRLAIARGMINNPELLFLDEPTSGLDPDVRLWIWEFLSKIRTEMGTVVLTTHYMEEAERLCDRVAIMENGKILALGTPKDLIRDRIGVEVVEFEVPAKDLAYYLTRLKEKNFRFQVVSNSIHVHLSLGQRSQDVMEIVFSKHIHIRLPNLNDVFLSVAGHDLQPLVSGELRGGLR
jgi:lipooligosaccharide transport system ATP-binding protein